MAKNPSTNSVTMEIEASMPSEVVDGIMVGLSPLSETLWRDRTKTEFVGDVSARLTWKDLTVMVTLSNGETQRVLEGLTGYAEPGTLTALMGPSGSGKSTLLDALSSRLAANAFLSGTVLLNGRKTKLSFGTAAYVTQDDNLLGTLTVRETISYSARLRLPDKMPWSEKRALVESTIIEMGLQDCADTVIGNWHLRGVSGGEKRRVSIALEILMRPRLLFLDEPTSGLDSASAFFVTQTLRGLSRDGRTVIASIHQPSSEVFELFDRLYLLSGGKTVYFGQVSEAYEFFAQAGFPCPALRNPSDHFLRCINSDFDKVKATLKGSMKLRFEASDDPLEKITTAEAIRTLIDHYRTSQCCYAAREKVEEISKVRGNVLEAGGSQASFLMQAFTLTKRSFINMSRDFGYYWLRLVIYIVVTVCIGTIYLNVGTGYNSILARGSCASFVFGFVTFMSIGGFPSFVEEMKVFQRERLNGHYGVVAFVISNTISAMPFLIMITFISGTVCYFMVRLHPGFEHYVFFVLCLYASVILDQEVSMDEPDELHIAMFPWLAFGHIIPFLELAKLIAQRGHKISFISTPRNIQRLPSIPPNLTPRINLVSLALPHVENLPNNAEATADLPFDKIPFLKEAYDRLQDSLFHFLHSSSPDWIIFDFIPYWLPEIATKLGISGVLFSIFGAWTISFAGPSYSAILNGDDPRTEPQHFTVPPKWVTFPSKVAFRIHEAKRFLDQIEMNSSGVTDMFRWGSVLAGCDVIAIRSCLELEADFLRLVEDLHCKPVIPVGLLPPPAQCSDGGVDEKWVTISEWLDKQTQGSVVYIAFGSELTMNQDEITELALGLELSGLAFFWAFRNRDDSVRLPDGFEERVKGRGVVWTSWAPQLRIMAHESVGGFLTHCGYSSVIEALSFGLALIMLPFAIDQGLIARVFEGKKVGIEVPRDEQDGSFTRNSVAESLRLVIVDKEGSAYRENAKQQMATLFGDETISDRCMDQFVAFLRSHRKLPAVIDNDLPTHAPN